jgi:hypothetical protein
MIRPQESGGSKICHIVNFDILRLKASLHFIGDEKYDCREAMSKDTFLLAGD